MWVRRAVIVTAATLIAVGAMLSPAAAHNDLRSSTPAADTTAAIPPAAVVLTFAEAVDPATTTVTVTGPDGATVSQPAVFDGVIVTVPLTPGPAGTYTVSYQITASDGDVGTRTFRFAAGAGDAPTPSLTPPAPTSAVIGPATATGRASQDSGTPLWAYAVAAAAGLVAIAAVLAALRRRPTS